MGFRFFPEPIRGFTLLFRLALVGAILLAGAAVSAEPMEVWFDQFDRDTPEPTADFWEGTVPEGLHGTGALRLQSPAQSVAIRSRSLSDAPLHNQYTIHARLSASGAASGSLEIILRSDGQSGYAVTFDSGPSALRLRALCSAPDCSRDLVAPVPLPTNAQPLFLRTSVEGYGPVTLRVDLSRTPDFDAPFVTLEHTEKAHVFHGDRLRLRASGTIAAEVDYLSVGAVGYAHPAVAWDRSGYTDAPPGGSAVSIGRLLGHEVEPSGAVILRAEGGRVRVLPRLQGVVKVEFLPGIGDAALRPSWSVTRTHWPSPPPRIRGGDPLRIDGDGWSVAVDRDPLRLTFLDAQGRPVIREALGLPLESKGLERRLAFRLEPGESLYAMGQHDLRPEEVRLDLRGHRYRVENRHGPTSIIVMPFWLSSRRYAVLVDNAGLASIDVGAAASDVLEYRSRAGDLAYYVFLGETPAQVLDRYTQVVGRPALAPRWTLGTMQSRFGYKSFAELQEIVDGFRRRRIPLQTMIIDLDWFGISRMGNLEFQDNGNWPEPAQSLQALRDQGIRTIPITEPQITGLSVNAPDVLARGLVARERDDRMPHATRVWWITNAAPVYLLDFTRPETRAWWGERHRRLILDYGFDGFWQDLNEPEGISGTMRWAGGTTAEVQNVIALQMNRALAEGLEAHKPGARPFIMSRSGFVGMQKYGAGVWSGDVGSNWFTFGRQPSVGLNMCLSGVPYWNSDVGGYGGETTPELYLRWCQFAFFNPIYRPHAAHMAREPWAFGPEVEESVRRLLLLRSRLVPYYYGAAREAYDTGMPMMRPLLLHWPDDPAVRDLADQFLYGPSLMAAPVLAEGARERDVYLPAGEWYDWFSGERHSGGATVRKAVPLEDFVLLVRAPAMVPLGPETMRVDEQPLHHVTLRAWLPADAVRARGELYEDDGLTDGYADSAFARTPFALERTGKDSLRLTIGPAKGTFEGMVKRRSWTVEINDVPMPMRSVSRPAPLSVSYDAPARRLLIEIPEGPVDSPVVVELRAGQ